MEEGEVEMCVLQMRGGDILTENSDITLERVSQRCVSVLVTEIARPRF